MTSYMWSAAPLRGLCIYRQGDLIATIYHALPQSHCFVSLTFSIFCVVSFSTARPSSTFFLLLNNPKTGITVQRANHGVNQTLKAILTGSKTYPSIKFLALPIP